MDPDREEQLKFAKHFERAQGWLLLENHAAADRALRLIPASSACSGWAYAMSRIG